METEVLAYFTYFLPLHLYLFYANKSAGSESVVTAKNYGGARTVPQDLP